MAGGGCGAAALENHHEEDAAHLEVSLNDTKELMDHSTVTVTMRYAHSNDEDERRALSRLTVVPRSRKKAASE